MSRVTPDIEIVLPDREHSKKTFICHNCESKMTPDIGSEVYHVNGKRIRVSNIRLYRCPKCQESIYSATEAGRIEEAVYGIR